MLQVNEAEIRNDVDRFENLVIKVAARSLCADEPFGAACERVDKLSCQLIDAMEGYNNGEKILAIACLISTALRVTDKDVPDWEELPTYPKTVKVQ